MTEYDYDVAILSHVSSEFPFETTEEDLLTQFFQRPVARAAAAEVVTPAATAGVCDVGEDVKHKLAILKRMYAL
jgi:hypothetical protein